MDYQPPPFFSRGPEPLHRREPRSLERIDEEGDGLAQRFRVAEARVEHHQENRERYEKPEADERRRAAAEKRRRLVIHGGWGSGVRS